MKFKDAVQPQILGIHPYVPGKPVEELQRELGLNRVSKLASNENPLGASPKVDKALHQAMAELSRYPDGSAFQLKEALSEFLEVKSDRIAVGNGSNELLELVARVFAGPGDEVVYSQYGFAVYPLSAQVVGATGIEVAAKAWGHDLDAMLAAVTSKTKLIYIANPNNPTGTRFGRAEWEAFISQVPARVIVVLDEAYLEFCHSDDYPNGIDYLDDYPNLLVSRTFSKAYGLASLRIGYMVGFSEIIQYINQVREPFNVNYFAQVAAMAALQDQAFVKRSVQANQAGMRQMVDFFESEGIEYIPSDGNFVCVRLGAVAGEINAKLLEKGVIVRPVANYGLDEFLRVSIGTEVENSHFIEALQSLLKNKSR